MFFFKISSFHDRNGISCTEASTARLVSISFLISLRTRASILHFPEKMRRPKGDFPVSGKEIDPTVWDRWIR